HIHVPAGAIPKDGPSAGVALYIALVSLLTNRTIRPEVAMTGEITLRGLVLPVGGIKEKTLAALRAGIKTVLLPARNQKDAEEIPESARRQLDLHWIARVDEAEALALTPLANQAPEKDVASDA
ncbi:MAG: S16 family serine protease, partial [Porticoccaceae bacterium]